MDSVRKAIGEALVEDEALAALLSKPGEIHHDKAPADAAYPYAIFRLQSPERPSWTMQGPPAFEEMLWLVKGVCRGLDAEGAEDINTRCAEILNDADLEITGPSLRFCLRESGMPPYSEDDSGETIYHRGSLYRVVVEP